jgi:fructose-1,6-bisphosphatase/inositol monophosphatase family enzyme
MSLLAELGSEPRVPQWRHWIVGVEPIGRITRPAVARHLLGTVVLVQAVSRERMLVLRTGSAGTNLPIDRRGRLVLPAWFRETTRVHFGTGSLLVTEAGAILTDMAGQPWTFRSNSALVSASSDLHRELLEFARTASASGSSSLPTF